MGWACGAYGWGEGAYRVLVGKPEGKRPLVIPRRKWVDNIRMDLQEVGCGHINWIGLAQDRDRWRTLVSAVMNLRVPWIAWNFLTSCKPVSFSRKTLHRGVSEWVLYSVRRGVIRHRITFVALIVMSSSKISVLAVNHVSSSVWYWAEAVIGNPWTLGPNKNCGTDKVEGGEVPPKGWRPSVRLHDFTHHKIEVLRL